MQKISLVAPCYNEEKNISHFFNSVKKAFNQKDYNYEIIFIDDGSKDKTLFELKKLKSDSFINVKIISFSRNFGKESAIYAGLLESTGDYVAIIDTDMQQDPKLVVSAVKMLNDNSNYDSIAYCQKQRREGLVLSIFKRMFYTFINRLSDVEFVQGSSDFRVMKRIVVDSILNMSEKNRFSKGIFSWVGFNTKYIEYMPNKRAYGKTKWSFIKLFNYAISGIVSFTTSPLRFSTIVGLTASTLSFIYMVVVIIQKIFWSINIEGYATIVVLILFMGGVQLLSLGILGEYLSKTYIETKNRPIFIVKEKINTDN